MSEKVNYLQTGQIQPEKRGESVRYYLPVSAHIGIRKLKQRFSIMLPVYRLAMLLGQWQHNRRTRRQLAEMPDYLLKDIGLDRGRVGRELQKPFWKD